jgi:uncharacterized membrane protein (DUF4010 family)
METLPFRLGLALAIGLLVGFERGWRERDEPDHSRTAGIRTFGITGLLGGIFAALSQAVGSSAVLIAGFISFAAIFTLYKMREAASEVDFSATGLIAGLSVFALGALAVVGEMQTAAGTGAALAAVLASREYLHGMLKRLTWTELRSALILAVMTAVILPLLPNRTIDPWAALNPREIWLFTVLTAAISYLGYIAVRIFGATRGLVVSAASGALISSTAVTLALGRSAKSGDAAAPMAGAASLAALVSILRVCLVVAVIEPTVLASIWLPALTAAATFAAGGAIFLYRGADGAVLEASHRSPFDLGPLLLFALMLAVVSVLSSVIALHVGTSGLLVTSALSGAVDVDVAVLSALRLVGTAASVDGVARAVLAAMAINALLRVAIAVIAAPLRFWFPLLSATLLALGLAAAVFVVTISPPPF